MLTIATSCCYKLVTLPYIRYLLQQTADVVTVFVRFDSMFGSANIPHCYVRVTSQFVNNITICHIK